MKKLNTAPISGMLELLPKKQAVFNQIKDSISKTFSDYGFQPIETPSIERTEILFAKAGGDTEKQIYKVVKTTESADDADQALRFDHTVPLARYVVEHANDLTFPFKVSQIGRNFRGERAQRGRFREFYQCDIDIIGRNHLPIEYDAEIISTFLQALTVFRLSDLRVHISNRKLLNGLLEALNLTPQAKDIFSIVDHATKVPLTTTKKALKELDLGANNLEKILTFLQISGDHKSLTTQFSALKINNQTFNDGVEELTQVLSLLEQTCPKRSIVANMMIVRGLDYYTGTVFETFSDSHLDLGSLGGGGRYDNLASQYSDLALPGVGGSIGLSRLFYLLDEAGLIKEDTRPIVDTALIPLDSSIYPFANNLRQRFLKKGVSTDIIYGSKKLSDKLTYAAKIAQHACVLGEDELTSRKIKIKNLTSGQVETIEITD